MRAARSLEDALSKSTKPADERCIGGSAHPALTPTAPDLHRVGAGTVKRAAIYVRVSTANRSRDGNGFEQNPEVQEIPLRQLVQQRGWTLARVYSDRLAEQRRIARA